MQQSEFGGVYGVYFRLLKGLVYLLAGLAGLAIVVMMGVTCVDVILRFFRSPLKGAYDIVNIAGAVTIAGALPYTTAVKGHVAIEFLYLNLSRRGRIILDTIMRLVLIALFATLCWQSWAYGDSLRRSGEVSMTLKFPACWIAYVLSVSCGATLLVKIHHLFHPGRTMIKP